MQRSIALIAGIALSAALTAGQSFQISTVAGKGRLLFAPGPGKEVRLVQPAYLGADGQGTVYISDVYFHTVLRLTSDGELTVLAGTGEPGFRGDGGPANEASLNNPRAVAVAANGDVYIADATNARIRRVAAETGIITTVAGTGAGAATGDGGPARQAALGSPAGLAFDGLGRLYVSDLVNHVVRRIDEAGVITTVAGSRQLGFTGDNGPAVEARLFQPQSIAVDGNGNLYICDTANQRIRRVDGAGRITTLAGDGNLGFAGDNGPAVAARFSNPNGVAAGPDGSVYIADTSNGRIRVVRDGIISTLIGGGRVAPTPDPVPEGRNAVLGATQGVIVDGAGHLLFCEPTLRRVSRAQAPSGGDVQVAAGVAWRDAAGDGGPATEASLLEPRGIAADQEGNIFVSDRMDQRIRKVDAAGVITTVVGTGLQASLGDGGPARDAALSQPGGMAYDSEGSLYIVTTGGGRVRKIDRAGLISTYAGGPDLGFGGDGGQAVGARFNFATGLAFDAADNLYIADTVNHRVRRIDRATGVITTVAGNGAVGFSGDGGPAVEARLSSPAAVVADGEGNLYIADRDNNRIRKVDPTGVISTIAGMTEAGIGPDGVEATASRLSAPGGLLRDAAGNLYVAHGGNGQIRRIGADGIIQTVAGLRTPGFSGDGGPADQAALSRPLQMALDAAGRILFIDFGNLRVRALTP